MSAPAQDFVAQVDAQVDVGVGAPAGAQVDVGAGVGGDVGGAQVDVGGGAQVDVGGGAGGGAGAGAGAGAGVGGGAGGGGAGGGGAGGVGGGGVGGGGVVAGAEGRLVSVSSGGVGSGVGVGVGLCLPSVSELRDLLCLTSATLRRSVEGGARQQSQLEQQQEQLSLQAAHTRLIGEQLRGVHELQRCQSGQLERLDAGQRLQSEQLAQLGSGQRQQGEQLSRALASLEDFKKAMGAQAPALGQKIDSIASSQASDFNSFPLLMKQVVALMATKLMDSKNGFVVCFPTVVAREQQQTESRGGGGAGAGAGAGGSRLVFMICVPLLMQGMVLFDKVLARKISMTLLRKMIGDYLPLLGLTDELYEAAYRTFPCTQYKGPSGRKAGKAQKEKYCTFHHPDALLPLLRQGQAHAHQYGYKAGVLADDIQNKEFRDLPGKNQMWIGVHSDAYLGNWGSKVNVVALQDDIDAYDEFVKCCQEQEPVQGNGSSGSGSSSSSSSGSSSSSAAGAGAGAGAVQ